MFDAKVKVLGEYIDHHVKEERNEIFVKARAARGLDLVGMREQLQARKEELMAERPGATPSKLDLHRWVLPVASHRLFLRPQSLWSRTTSWRSGAAAGRGREPKPRDRPSSHFQRE